MKMYWIKINLHKDKTPLWHGVKGALAKRTKIAELKRLGYNPMIDKTKTVC